MTVLRVPLSFKPTWSKLEKITTIYFSVQNAGNRRQTGSRKQSQQSQAINPPFNLVCNACEKDCYARIRLLSNSRHCSHKDRPWLTKALPSSFEIDGCLLPCKYFKNSFFFGTKVNPGGHTPARSGDLTAYWAFLNTKLILSTSCLYMLLTLRCSRKHLRGPIRKYSDIRQGVKTACQVISW